MSDEWKYVDLPGYLVGKPAKWDEDKKEWVAYTGVNDVTVTNPPEPVDVQEISGTVDIGNLPEPVDVHKVEVTNQNDPVTDYPDASTLEELKSLKSEIAEQKQQNAEILERLDGVFDTQVIGSIVEQFGATEADRPDASTVPVGTVFIAVDSQEAWQSNGTSWVVV